MENHINLFDKLSKNELASILSFLNLKNLITCSRVNKKFFKA